MADGSVPLVLSPEPFSRAVAYLEQPAGRTLRAALVEAVRQGSISADDLSRTVVYVDGVRLERDQTLDHVLREGEVVNIVVEPLGGGGGRKEIGQILMTIAVIAVSMWVGGGAGGTIASTLLARVAAAAVLTLGQAAVAAIFAPEAENKAKTNERYALQSASNQYRPWSAFPLALGEVVVAPDFAAKTYTQAVGDDVWIYGILGLHAGACAMSEMKIGDTLVSSMGAGDFRMVEHLTPGPRTFSIYPNDVDQLDLQEELEATVGGSTPVIRAASAEGERFEFDFFLPGGLHFQKDDGRVIAASVTLTVRYRPVDDDGVPTGGGAWTNGLTVPLTSTTKEPWRIMRSLSLPMGRYEFEIKRSAKPDANEKRRDNVAITAIRAIAFRKPVADETLSIVEFAVRATALNQGTLAPITCRIIPLCETWNGEAWTAAEPTSNPAALVRWLLTGPAPARPLLPEQADVRLRAWAELCDEYDWKAGLYLIDDRRQADVLAMLEQAGRASLFWDGTQIVASAWVEKPAPRQLFTGTNLKDHRWTIVYPEPVHALRVEFQNIDEGSEPDELYVYADGYGETDGPGVTAAVLVEALRLEGQKTAERAYRDGRWELGRRLHQRRIDTWTADAEHLVSSYGDRVRLAWQRVEGGTSSRVRCRRWTGGMVTGLRLSQPVEMVPGEAYAVDIRLVGEVIVAVPVINEAEDAPVITREIQFAVPREPGSSPKRDDLIAFGVPTRISEDTEIIGIEPGKGLTASLTGVRYVAPLLMAGETGPIPPLQTRLSRQRAANPPAPQLLGFQPEPSGVRVSYAMPPWSGSPIVGFAARWRPTPADGEETGWMPLPALAAGSTTLVTPPPRALPIAQDEIEGATFIDVEIRALTESGQSSPEPLFVGAIEVREDPFAPLGLTLAPATRVAPGGSSHGVLIVSVDPLSSAQGVELILEVRRAPLVGAPDDWESAGLPLSAANPVGDILGLRSGERYGVRAAWRSAGGWVSAWTDEERETVPAGSNVSDDTANISGVASDLFVTRMVDVESLAAATATAVSDLEDIYGDTASAAASAAAAALSEAAAIAAEAAAIIAQGAAATSASGAASSASAASSSATAASTSASAASVSATSSAASATTAAGHAATASTQAGLAATSAGLASGSATAAAGSASAASTAATAAGNSASAAAASQVSAASSYTAARDAAASVFPETFTNNGEAFTNVAAGSPSSVASSVVTTIAGFGPAAGPLNANGSYAGTRQVLPTTAGKVYEVSGEIECISLAVGAAASPNIHCYGLDGSFTYVNVALPTFAQFSASGEIRTISRRFSNVAPSGGTAWPASCVWLRFGIGATGSATTTYRVRRLTVRDVTALVSSEVQASAAATSASSAATSATNAGTSASAASTSATNASTSAGAASTSATNASNSATTAAGHASTASTAATNAATSAGLASGSASAASGSASSAATSATAAGNSATAAAASQVAAASSFGGAIAVTKNGYFSQGIAGWLDYGSGAAVASDSGRSNVYKTTVGASSTLRTDIPALFPIRPGENWRISIGFRTASATGSGTLFYYIGLFFYDNAGNLIGGADGTGNYPLGAGWTFSVADGWQDRTVIVGPGAPSSPYGGTTTFPAGATRFQLVSFYNYLSDAAGSVSFDYFTAEPATGELAAANSASAAVTSASSAATSATAAGSSATAASGSATTASTQAGNASTSASSASTSASNAATSATTASTAASTATSAAATATTQASNASASAASASASAVLAATVANRSLLQGSTFSAYTGSPLVPNGWVHWSGAAGYTSVAGEAGGFAYRAVGPAGVEEGIYQNSAPDTLVAGNYYVMEARVRLDSGTLAGAGVTAYSADNAMTFVSYDQGTIYFPTTPDVNGNTVGAGTVGNTYSFSRLFQAAVGAKRHRTYAMTHYSGLGSIAAANQLTWFLCSVRPATAAEVAAGVALPTLSASVAATQLVVADLATNYSLARYTLSALTPGGAAILSLVSSSYGSVAGLSADQIYWGENTYFDNATDTVRTTTGATLRVVAYGAAFGTDGTLLEWEGSSAVAFASMSRANAYHYTANATPYAGGSRRLVRTDTVENEAITKEWRFDSQALVSFVPSGAMTTRTTMFSMTLTATGKKITFDGKYLLDARHSQDAWNLYVVVERLSGSTTTDVFTSKRGALAISGDGYISDWQHISFSDTPPAGSTVYTVRAYHDYTIGGPGAFIDYGVSNKIMAAREHKTES